MFQALVVNFLYLLDYVPEPRKRKGTQSMGDQTTLELYDFVLYDRRKYLFMFMSLGGT